MNAPQLIAERTRLHELVQRLRAEEHLAVDTESNGFYAYTPRICLIQLSTSRGDYVLDPLALEDLTPLAAILADPAVEKILHAAENDLIGLQRDFRFRIRNIFDTAVACRMLGRRRLGLARILSEEFGVTLDKKLQRCNWGQRPLSTEQLYYAQLDTHFLIQLRHKCHRQLVQRNVWGAAQAKFARLEQIRPKPTKDWQPEGYLRLKGAQELSPTSLRALGALYAYRESLARKTNKAPFRIMGNEVLVRLAREMPRNRAALLSIRGLPFRFKGKSAGRLLRILQS